MLPNILVNHILKTKNETEYHFNTRILNGCNIVFPRGRKLVLSGQK